ncbi:MAG: transglycosylase SLT domain-containing protein [Candidatus Levybacteria bacterium]|nr:transglycosylase SLT domain-containing protein [Candidatus Levybacteria bacterium]
MLDSLTALAFASLLSVGSLATSIIYPAKQTPIASPLPVTKAPIVKTPSITPTPLPTATPTPLPTATPTPTLPPPTPPPTLPPTPQELEQLFDNYSQQFGVDKELLKRIANCESGFNPNAQSLDYGGMFQFSSQSWSRTRNAMGQDANTNLRFNSEEAIKTAAFKISQGGVGAWPNCSK